MGNNGLVICVHICLCEYYKLKRCLKKECCKQCRHVKFKGTMTKWPVQKIYTRRTAQKHAEQNRVHNRTLLTRICSVPGCPKPDFGGRLCWQENVGETCVFCDHPNSQLNLTEVIQ